jgi:hypothetical protein
LTASRNRDACSPVTARSRVPCEVPVTMRHYLVSCPEDAS